MHSQGIYRNIFSELSRVQTTTQTAYSPMVHFTALSASTTPTRYYVRLTLQYEDVPPSKERVM